jgi:hypothetical protein
MDVCAPVVKVTVALASALSPSTVMTTASGAAGRAVRVGRRRRLTGQDARRRRYTSVMVGRLVGALAVGLSALVLTACGADEPVEHDAAAPDVSAPGSPAPERISGITVDGQTIDVALDGRDVILWFWAPW